MSGDRVHPGRRCGGWRIAAALCMLVALGGCEGGKSQLPAAASTDEIRSVAERGPVQLEVIVSDSNVTVGETVTLAIHVVADEGVEVRMPHIGQTLGPFDVREPRTPPDVPDANQPKLRRWRHQYALSTLDSGELEIPSIAVHFTDRRRAADAPEPTENELATEAIAIAVSSVVGEDFDPSSFRDVKAPLAVDFASPNRGWWWIVAGAALCAVLTAALILLRARREREPLTAPLPPHEWALEQLRQLAHEDLVAAGQLLEFYRRLSLIVRQYIELRFAIMAPERTTDEFLRDPRTQSLLDLGHQVALGEFLRAADMVKFALHRPEARDCQAALDAARSFILDTAPQPEESAQSDAPREVAA